MVLLRMMMLRKWTDPKTGTHTLCEPAPSRCKRQRMRKKSSKIASDQDRDTDFVRACAVEMHLDISQEPLSARSYR